MVRGGGRREREKTDRCRRGGGLGRVGVKCIPTFE